MTNSRENWYLWLDTKRSPAMNMAIDESLLSVVHNKNIPCLRIYGWDRDAMSIGYIQKYSSVAKKGYSVVRRPTGGGVVFHDIDLTYTVVIPKGHFIEHAGREQSYHIIHEIIIDSLSCMKIDTNLVTQTNAPKDRSSMQCFTAPVKFDVAYKNLQTGEEHKIAGAAQRRTGNGILHQGSIVLEDIGSIKTELTDSLIKSFSRKLDINFIDFVPDLLFMKISEGLARSKYETDLWNKQR